MNAESVGAFIHFRSRAGQAFGTQRNQAATEPGRQTSYPAGESQRRLSPLRSRSTRMTTPNPRKSSKLVSSTRSGFSHRKHTIVRRIPTDHLAEHPFGQDCHNSVHAFTCSASVPALLRRRMAVEARGQATACNVFFPRMQPVSICEAMNAEISPSGRDDRDTSIR